MPARVDVTCIDLREQSSWRVFYSEDHAPGSQVDPWNLELRGPGGSRVYPAGGADLAAYSSRRGLHPRLEVLGRVTQRGDRELTVRFPADRLAKVAALLRCYRKQIVSDERRAQLRAAGAKGRAKREDWLRNGATAASGDDMPPAGRGVRAEVDHAKLGAEVIAYAEAGSPTEKADE